MTTRIKAMVARQNHSVRSGGQSGQKALYPSFAERATIITVKATITT